MSSMTRPPGLSQTISTDELRKRLNYNSLAVVDVRSMAAYNGWRLNGEARGGHISTAVPFPADWVSRMEGEDLEQILSSKGISPEKTIILYGDGPADGAPLAANLHGLGYEDVVVYEDGFGDWADDGDLPVDRLPRHVKLVHPEWVRRLLNGERPQSYSGNGFAVFHVNFGVPEEYEDGHIPGAFYLDTNYLESAVDWNRRAPEELEVALLAHGITRHTTVVVYGRDTEGHPEEKWPGRRAGQIAATRAAAILLYAGVADVRLLDGGYDQWVSTGNELESVIRRPLPARTFGADIPQRPDYIVDIEEAKSILANPNGALVSVRTWAEHTGRVSGYNYIEARGRIAGDVWGNCGSDAYHMQHYRNVDNTMRSYHEIAANWHEAAITPDKRVAFYCGTGWRASETFFYAYVMGWERIAVYDGGWFEWSKDPINNPIEFGAS